MVSHRLPLTFGVAESPPSRQQLEHAEAPALGAWLGLPPERMPLAILGEPLRRLRLKHWQFVSIASPSLFLGLAVATTHYLSLGFAYAYRRATRRLEEYRALVPLASGFAYDGTPVEGHTRLHHRRLRLAIDRQAGMGERQIVFDAREGGNRLRGHLTMHESDPLAAQPLSLLTDLGGGRPSYTYKAAGIPVSGGVFLGGEQLPVRAGEGVACLDWTLSYATRVTTWNWAAGAGYGPAGRLLGFNLARGIHETAGGLTENALWVDGRRTPVGTVRFSFDPVNPMNPWWIRSDDGRVDLRFVPEGIRREDVNLLVVVSRLRQPFGAFRGRLVDEQGVVHAVENLFGVVEDHFSRW